METCQRVELLVLFLGSIQRHHVGAQVRRPMQVFRLERPPRRRGKRRLLVRRHGHDDVRGAVEECERRRSRRGPDPREVVTSPRLASDVNVQCVRGSGRGPRFLPTITISAPGMRARTSIGPTMSSGVMPSKYERGDLHELGLLWILSPA